MAIEIDKQLIRDDEGVVKVGEAATLEISDEEARNVYLYETFSDINSIDPSSLRTTMLSAV